MEPKTRPMLDQEDLFDEYFSQQDIDWLENLAAYWYGTRKDYKPFTNDEQLAIICAKMAQRLLEDDPQGVEWILEQNESDFMRYADDETFRKVALMALEYGVALGNGPCANYLGALHVMGTMVPLDRRRAVELFMIGEREGVAQSAVNLGYSYEYGWLGEPDYTKAFMQYAKCASLGEHAEALYKLGDMYARAKVVEQDLRVAYLLYEKSFSKAGDDLVNKAQSAFRMAQLMEDPANQEWDIPYDIMRAFALYQLAERGLRIDIAHGQTYYRRRLREAMEGQERIRAMLESGEVEL